MSYFIIQIITMNKVAKGVHSVLRMCDLFAVSQFVKYKGESDYKTATGGFFSVAILTIFAVLFTSMAIKTVDRQIITWSSETTNEMEPSPTTVTVSPAPFLFTVGIMYLNVNNPAMRYFDFTLKEKVWSGPVQLSSRNISLVPCTEDHFAITEALKQSFHSTPAYKWLCPALGEQFTLSGKFTSHTMSYLELSVWKCDPLLDPTRPCANSTVMHNLQANFGQFTLSQFFINPLLNPGSQNHLDYYLEDRNYIAFSSNIGTYSSAHVQDYTIITDQSILPFAIPKEESGVIIPELFQNINFEVTNDLFAQQYFYKSSSSTTYNRAFYKIDEFFSYVGGLVGVIMGGMMLLSAYNQDSFEFSLAHDLIGKEDGNALERYNIFYYIMLFFHSIFKNIWDRCKNWENLRKFEEVREEMAKQLDVSLILARILFLERSIQIIFEKGQFEAMHLSKKLTFSQLKALRNCYQMRDRLKVQSANTAKPPLAPSLDQSQDGLKQPKQPIIIIEHNGEHQGINEDYGVSSDEEEIPEEVENNFKDSIKQFQQTVVAGNHISIKISKGIKWNDLPIELQNMNDKEAQRKDLKQDIRSIHSIHSIHSIEQIHNSEESMPDPSTQMVIIKPKKKSSNGSGPNHNFDFITFLQ